MTGEQNASGSRARQHRAVGQWLVSRWQRTATVYKWALAVLAVHLIVRVWLIVPGEYTQDDFVFLYRMREHGLSFDTLTHVHNGHVIPVTMAASWLVGLLPGGYLPAAIIVVVLQLLASVTLWWFLARAVGPTPGMLVAFAAACFTPLMFSTVTWWAASVMMLGLQIATSVAGVCHLEYQRSGSARWLLGAVVALIVGFVFWQKAIFVPAFLVVTTVLMSEPTARRIGRALLRLWPAWLMYAALTAGYLAFYLRVASVGDTEVASATDFAKLGGHQAIDVFLRGMLGGPWHHVVPETAGWVATTPFGFAALLQVLALLVIVAYWFVGRIAIIAAICVSLVLLLDVVILARGRGLFADLIQTDPRYVCDAVPIAALAIAVVLSSRNERMDRIPGWLLGRGQVLASLAVVLVFNSSMLTASSMARVLHRPETTSYVANARESADRDADLVLFDGWVPADLMIGLFPDDERRVSVVLDSYHITARYDRPSEDMRILDDSGTARPIDLIFRREAKIDAADSCGVALTTGTRHVFGLDDSVPEGNWVMELAYFSARDAVVEVAVSNRTQLVGLREGAHRVLLTIAGRGSTVGMTMVRGEGTVCIPNVTIGMPVPRSPADMS